VSAPDTDGSVRLTVSVRGQVQGVGFRWWTRARALELGLVGSASNRPDGRVEVVAEGPREACERLLSLLGEPFSTAEPETVAAAVRRPGRVLGVSARWSTARGDLRGFVER
jgi:acylphosphatase